MTTFLIIVSVIFFIGFTITCWCVAQGNGDNNEELQRMEFNKLKKNKESK